MSFLPRCGRCSVTSLAQVPVLSQLMSGVSREDRQRRVRVRLMGLFACCRLPSNTGGYWSGIQGTFGPLHIKHPGKSNSSGQREQFQKEEKEEQEV